MIELAPIAMFVYNRPEHTLRTLEALANNPEAKDSILYVYSDGPKENASYEELEQIKATRNLVRQQQWAQEVILLEREKNIGLAASIINGITEVVNRYGKIIVLEDDIVVSKGFLNYMNSALDIYKDISDVMHISGFMHPINSSNLPNTFFYNVNSCWGWGTWSDSWVLYENNPHILQNRLLECEEIDWEKYNGFQGNEYYKQLLLNISGQMNTWAVKWHTSLFLNKGKAVHPKISLTRNIGFDNTGVHCGKNNSFSEMEILDFIEIDTNELIKDYNLINSRIQSSFLTQSRKISVVRKIKNLLKKIIRIG